MNRELEYRLMKSRVMRVAYLAGWHASRRALGNPKAEQRADRAWQRFHGSYFHISSPNDTTVPASGGTEA